ncbi:MAG: uroporphyrinogen-III synthase [Myxococcota bacterium]
MAVGFGGRVVAGFESRRADELAQLIRTHAGSPIVAPAIEERLLEPGPGTIQFVEELRAGEVDGVLFLTRGGVEYLPRVLAPVLNEEELRSLLRKVPLGARGPKTAAALRVAKYENITTSEPPHTWRELLRSFHEAHDVGGKRIATVETGVAHNALRAGLHERGARMLEVSVYRWVLPEDTQPMVSAIQRLADGTVDVALFTSGTQIDSLMGVASEIDLDDLVRKSLQRIVVGAIGPVTYERIAAFGVEATVVPTEGTMGALVSATAEYVASQ